jgi:hypothetical protein
VTVGSSEFANAPVIQLPGIGAPPVPAPVYIDGIPVAQAAPPVSPSGRLSRANQFWSSTPRPATSQIEEDFFVSLPKPREINYITFDLAHFPQVFSVWYLGGDQDRDDWKPVRWKNGTPVTIAVSGSIPRIVGSVAALAAGTNPYHYGAGHWDHYDEVIAPVTTTQLRFSGLRAGAARLPNWTSPVDSSGNPAPYPLGIRDLDFGYRVLDRDDVPYTQRSSSCVTERQPFTVSNDVHGSAMTVAVRENRASDLLQGYTWSSAPQLRADSVVNLYIDSRSPSGQPQVIGAFALDPVTSGAKYNLYYSASPPPENTTFTAGDTPIVAPAVQTGGMQLPATSTDGIIFAKASSWLQIATQVTGITPGSPWWVASSFQPQFAHADGGSYILADAGIFQIYFQAGTFYMSLATQTIITTFGSWAFPFAVNDEIVFSVVYDGANLFASMFWANNWYPVNQVPVAALPPVPAFQLGAALPATQVIYPQPYRTAPAVSQSNGPVTSFTVSKQSGTQPGDWILMYLFGTHGSSVACSGFTVLNSNGLIGALLYRQATGTEGASFNITGINSAAATVIIATTAGGTIDVIGSPFDATGPTASLPAQSVTMNNNGDWVLWFGGSENGFNAASFNITPPPGFTANVTNGAQTSNAAMMLASKPGWVAGPTGTLTGTSGSSGVFPSAVAIGWTPSQPTWSAMTGNYILTSMAIGQEQLNMVGQIDPVLVSFSRDPAAFVVPGQPGPPNVLCRFHPSYILPAELVIAGTSSTTSVNPWGFIGGAAESYAACSWTPVLADYALAQGLVEFDPILASVFKFEFTSLVAEPYDFLDPSLQTLTSQQMPAGQANLPSSLTHPRATVLEPGQQITQALAPTIAYSDTPAPKQPHPQSTALPRQAMMATTPAGQQALGKAGSLYNFQPYKPATVTATQAVAGAHTYGTSDYSPTGRVGYFVAIASILMYRVSYPAQDDTEEYTELFQDETNFIIGASSGPTQTQWSWSTGQLTTGDDFLSLSGVATATSAIFASNTTVTGVQFATTQSDAVQMLIDPSFAQPGLPTWAPVGDVSSLPVATGINTALGSMVEITRAPTAYSWALLQTQFPSWSNLQSLVTTWSGFVIKPSNSLTGGIAGAVPQAVSGAGRIYAAARVFSPVPLTQPLALQILDGATGAVIAEADDPVLGGTVTEWFVGYTVGTANYTNALTWSQVQGTYPTWASMTVNPNPNLTPPNLWNQIDLVQYPLGQTVLPQLIQRGITEDTWYVDNLSMFEDSIVWSFSNDGGASWYPAPDIRNNPSGAVVFGAPQQGIGNQLMWQLQGYRPQLTVSSLAIRPWYSIYPRGYPARIAGVGHGPNLSPLDYYPPIDSDPRWQAWDSPIPQTWYFTYQSLLASQTGYTPPLPPVAPTQLPLAVAGSNILAITAASQVPPLPPPPVTYLDVYLDTYIDYYGYPEAGDLYTDIYDDVYGYGQAPTTGTVHSATAAWRQSSVLGIAGSFSLPRMPLLGADLGNIPGNDIAVQDFITATGQPLALRRLYLGNQIPVSLAASAAAYDAGVRKVFFDFQPDTTNTPDQLRAFLASCQTAGLAASVSLWSNPDASFTSPLDYFEMLQAYVPVIQANGYQFVFVISNSTIMRKNGLPVWWPEPYVQVDAMSVGLYSTGITPGDPDSDNLSTAAHWADVNQVPFGLAEFGAEWSKIRDDEGEDFFEWIQDFFYSRVRAGKLVGDLVCRSTGTYSLVNAPHDWKLGYTYIGKALQGIDIEDE